MVTLATALFAAAACSPQQDSERFAADLVPVNGSGATGRVSLDLDGNLLAVMVDASGVEPERVHPQHIHGFDDGRQATCPTPGADSNGDGIVDAAEAETAYGPVRVPLAPFPTTRAQPDLRFSLLYMAPGGDLAYPFTVEVDQLRSLQGRHIVLHGLTVDGIYRMDVPVACGEIRRSG
ncbi:MAG: CHRD domain-containing protein [Actinomycetota bacterium]|nr:CHRD domain-containing protein [Actinomycetota bacterium]